MTPIQKVGQALRNHGCRGRGGMWTCPCHEDKTPSLSVSEGAEGQALLFCHAGCETPTIVSTIKLTMADLFPDGTSANGHGPPVKVRASVVASYRYVDEGGELLFEVLRYEPRGFKQRRPAGEGGWLWKLGDVRRVPYRLPELLAGMAAGDVVYICEGEKDVEAVVAAGGVATTNPGGAGKWCEEYAPHFAGARVVVVADRDEAGRKHADMVAASLRSVAAELQVVEAVEGKDAYDHLAAGHGLEDFVALDGGDLDEQHLEDEEAFWTARPALTHVRDFARARMTSPWAVLGVVLARVIAATPYSVKLPPIIGSHASLNLAVGLVGRSGDGKGAAEGTAEDAVALGEGMSRRFDTHKLGSGQGLAHGYMRHEAKVGVVRHADACLFTMHEVDHMVGLTGQRGSTLLPELRSALMGEQLGHLYVDPAKRLEVPAHSYRLALTIGIQPARSGVLLNDTDGGTPQRLVWVPTTDPDAPDPAPTEPAPLVWDPPSWPDVLPVCDMAREAIIANRRQQSRGNGDPLEGHRLLLREKVAAALDILSGRAEVSAEAWELAGTVLAVSDRARGVCIAALSDRARESNMARGQAEAERAVVVDEQVTEAAVQRVCSNVLRQLEGGEWTPRATLRRVLAQRDRLHFDAAIFRLVSGGQVKAEEAPDPRAPGGLGYRYRLV